MCQDPNTAKWAAGPFRIGPRAWSAVTLRPFVLGPHNMPVITDPARAGEDIPTAVLSAITHAKDANAGVILQALADALKTVDDDTASIFRELTELGLSDTPALRDWRHIMSVDLSFFRSETSQRLIAKGRTEECAQRILQVLDMRDVPVPDDARHRIVTCTELPILDGWFTRALHVTHAEELFHEEGEDGEPGEADAAGSRGAGPA